MINDSKVIIDFLKFCSLVENRSIQNNFDLMNCEIILEKTKNSN